MKNSLLNQRHLCNVSLIDIKKYLNNTWRIMYFIGFFVYWIVDRKLYSQRDVLKSSAADDRIGLIGAQVQLIFRLQSTGITRGIKFLIV